MKNRVIAGNSLKQVLKRGHLCGKSPVRSSYFLRLKSFWLKFLALHCKLNREVMANSSLDKLIFSRRQQWNECKPCVSSRQTFVFWIMNNTSVSLFWTLLRVSGTSPWGAVLHCPLLSYQWINKTSLRELVEAKVYLKMKINCWVKIKGFNYKVPILLCNIKEWKINLKHWAKNSILARFVMSWWYVGGSCLVNLTKISAQCWSLSTE